MYTYQYREIMIPKIEPIILFLMFCAMKYGYTIIATYIVKKIFTNTRRRKEIKNERNSLNAGFARNNHYSCFNVFFEVISYYHSSLFYTTISLDVCEAFSTFFFLILPLFPSQKIILFHSSFETPTKSNLIIVINNIHNRHRGIEIGAILS